MCGLDVGEFAWEELQEMVDEFNPCRITAALRVLKYHGIRRRVDYKKVHSRTMLKISVCLHFSCLLEICVTSQTAATCPHKYLRNLILFEQHWFTGFYQQI